MWMSFIALTTIICRALADNHQVELAQSLSSRGYLQYAASPAHLVHKIKNLNMDKESIIPLPKSDLEEFSRIVDDEMGFSKFA